MSYPLEWFQDFQGDFAMPDQPVSAYVDVEETIDPCDLFLNFSPSPPQIGTPERSPVPDVTAPAKNVSSVDTLTAVDTLVQDPAEPESPTAQQPVVSIQKPEVGRLQLKDDNSQDILVATQTPVVDLTSSKSSSYNDTVVAPRTVSKTSTKRTNPKSLKSSSKSGMAKQRAPRPEKRHLVRWTDELDKKLLLTIQSECNIHGVQLPWDAIGKTMGEHITGGAVIQHLAKLRIRMEAAGLPVPPPLRRGGGHKISTAKSTPSKVTPSKRTAARTSAAKLESAKKAMSETSDDEEYESDSEAEYGKPRIKRAKTSPKTPGRVRKFKNEDSNDEVNTPTKRGRLRQTSSGKRKMLGESSDNGTDPEDDVQQNGEDIVAAGAPFLSLVDDSPGKGQTGRKTIVKNDSLIVTLPLAGQPRDMIKIEKTSSITDDDSQATQDDPNGTRSSEQMQGGGTLVPMHMVSDQQRSVHHASYQGNIFDHGMLDSFPSHQRSQSDNTHSRLQRFSPGYGLGNGQFGNMMHEQDTAFSNGFGTFNSMGFGNGGLPNPSSHWQNPGFVMYDNDHSAHFDNAYGYSVPRTPQNSTPFQAHSAPIRPHVTTSFHGTVAPQSTPAGGDYSSAGASTVNLTPSSAEAVYNQAPWTMPDDISAGDIATDFGGVNDVVVGSEQQDEYGNGPYDIQH